MIYFIKYLRPNYPFLLPLYLSMYSYDLLHPHHFPILSLNPNTFPFLIFLYLPHLIYSISYLIFPSTSSFNFLLRISPLPPPRFTLSPPPSHCILSPSIRATNFISTPTIALPIFSFYPLRILPSRPPSPLPPRPYAPTSRPDLTPRPHAPTSRPDLTPRPHAPTSRPLLLPDLTPRPHAPTSRPDLTPRPHAPTSRPDLTPRPHAPSSRPDLTPPSRPDLTPRPHVSRPDLTPPSRPVLTPRPHAPSSRPDLTPHPPILVAIYIWSLGITPSNSPTEPPYSDMHPMRVLFLIHELSPPTSGSYSGHFKEFPSLHDPSNVSIAAFLLFA